MKYWFCKTAETFPFRAKKKWGQNRIDFFCIFCFDLIYFDMVFHKQLHIFLTRNSSYVDTGNGIWPCLPSIAVWHSCKKQRCSQHHKQSDWESVDRQMHSSLYSNGGGTGSSSILVLYFLGLLSIFKLSSTIVVLVSWICRKERGVKNIIFAFTLYFLLAKMKKGVTMSWNQMQVKDFVTES